MEIPMRRLSMNIRLTALVISLAGGVPAFAQSPESVGGTLYFEDGTSVRFTDFVSFGYSGCPLQAQRLGQRDATESTFRVEYQSSSRDIPVSAIQRIRLTSFEYGQCRSGSTTAVPLGFGEFRVVTRTGVSTTATRGGPSDVRVRLRDDLTGEARVQAFYWAMAAGASGQVAPPRINLREIVFDP